MTLRQTLFNLILLIHKYLVQVFDTRYKGFGIKKTLHVIPSHQIITQV